MVDRTDVVVGDQELGLDAALSAPELRRWVGRMECALGAVWRLTDDENNALVVGMEDAGYVTLRDLGEATAEDLQTQLQLPRPMARRMQKYFAGEMAQKEAREGVKAAARVASGSASQAPIGTPQPSGTGSAFTQVGSEVQVRRRHTVVWSGREGW